MPSVRVDFWKEGKNSAFILTIDVEKEFDNIEGILKIINKHSLPTTLSVVSGLLKSKKDIVLDNLTKKYELASLSNSDWKVKTTSLNELFNHLESSRLDIEELMESKVVGVRSTLENFDEESINAIVQNNFAYVFGGQKNYRYYPLSIASGELIIFPRVVFDDYKIHKSRKIAGERDIIMTLKDDLKRVQSFGGGYFFNVHTDIFGKNVYLNSLSEFLMYALKSDSWVTTLSDVSFWMKKRRNLSVRVLKTSDGECILKVENRNKETLSGITISVEGPMGKIEEKKSRIKLALNEKESDNYLDLKLNQGKVFLPPLLGESTLLFRVRK